MSGCLELRGSMSAYLIRCERDWTLSGTFPYLPVTTISSGGVWAKAGETASGASPTQNAPIIARVREFVIILSHNVVPGSWLLTFERGWCSEMTYRDRKSTRLNSSH